MLRDDEDMFLINAIFDLGDSRIEFGESVHTAKVPQIYGSPCIRNLFQLKISAY